MKLVFMDFRIFLRGSVLSSYNLEKGERIDFLCITNENEVFNSFLYLSSDLPFSKDFEIVKNEEVYLFVKKRQNGLKIFFQEEIYAGNERILATIFSDGRTYCSLESEGKYNVLILPENGNNYKVTSSSFGDNIFITFDKDSEQFVKVLNSSNFVLCFEGNAKNVKVDDNRIWMKTAPTGIAERITESTYLVQAENVTLHEQVHECANAHVRKDALLGIMFLESVKDGDFDFILSIIDEELRKSLDDLKSYFSGIFDFFPTTKNDVFIVAKNGKKEFCQFVYENGKITDILID